MLYFAKSRGTAYNPVLKIYPDIKKSHVRRVSLTEDAKFLYDGTNAFLTVQVRFKIYADGTKSFMVTG